MRQLQQMQEDWLNGRPVAKEDNLRKGRVEELLDGEHREFKEEEDPEKKARELVDFMLFALTWMTIHGFDAEEKMREKIAFNHVRYSAVLFQSGDYEKQRAIVKEREKAEKLGEQFYSIQV